MDTGQLPHPLMYGMPIAGTDAAGFNPRRGTLTGLAIRTSDGQKVLATNIHVIADLGPFDGTPQPLGFEEMYAGSVPEGTRRTTCWVSPGR